MYKVSYFSETDEEKVFEMMERNPFAIVTGILNGFPVATHIPLEIEKRDNTIILKGHIMKETDHYKAFMQNENVLVIFTGPNCYVSASWYVTKNVASTWNYMDVYIKGKIKFTDAEGTKKIIEGITNKYEKDESEAAYKKMPLEYINRMAEAIVGLYIEVESMENVFKLSQNRDEISKQQIIENLKKSDNLFAREIAREMALRQV
ncbi:MAG: FMN-binding negative transcriptional regulator [Ginsengibacter sp.]